jgi:hypothetical protein
MSSFEHPFFATLRLCAPARFLIHAPVGSSGRIERIPPHAQAYNQGCDNHHKMAYGLFLGNIFNLAGMAGSKETAEVRSFEPARERHVKGDGMPLDLAGPGM